MGEVISDQSKPVIRNKCGLRTRENYLKGVRFSCEDMPLLTELRGSDVCGSTKMSPLNGVQPAKCRVQSAECKVQNAGVNGSSRRRNDGATSSPFKLDFVLHRAFAQLAPSSCRGLQEINAALREQITNLSLTVFEHWRSKRNCPLLTSGVTRNRLRRRYRAADLEFLN